MKKIFTIFFLILNIIIVNFLNLTAYINFNKNEVKIDNKKLTNILANTNEYKGKNFKNSFDNNNYENLLVNEEYKKSTDFSMENYFANLDKYMPNNSAGSCGYVAVASALSYYDNFYNDDIIPEKYEFFENAKNLEEAKKISPGLYNDFIERDKTDFLKYVMESKEYDFQSYLISIFKAKNNDLEANFGLYDYNYKELINIYFEDKLNLKPKFSIFTLSNDNIHIIKKIIKTNNPVLVGLKKEVGDGAHRVIAYGIDNNDNILINAGWAGSKYNKYKLNDFLKEQNYKIYNGFTLNFDNIKMKRSDNYHINGRCFSGSNINDNVITLEDINRFLPPTFLWMLTNNKNEKVILKFYDEKEFLFKKEFKGISQFTLSYQFWKEKSKEIEKLKIIFQRFDDSGKEYAETYNFFDISEIKIRGRKINIDDLDLGEVFTSKSFTLSNGNISEKIRFKNAKSDMKEIILGISPFKQHAYLKFESEKGINAISIRTNLKNYIRKNENYDLFIKNEKGEKYKLYDLLDKEFLYNNTEYKDLLLIFPKAVKFFSIELSFNNRSIFNHIIKELTLYEQI